MEWIPGCNLGENHILRLCNLERSISKQITISFYLSNRQITVSKNPNVYPLVDFHARHVGFGDRLPQTFNVRKNLNRGHIMKPYFNQIWTFSQFSWSTCLLRFAVCLYHDFLSPFSITWPFEETVIYDEILVSPSAFKNLRFYFGICFAIELYHVHGLPSHSQSRHPNWGAYPCTTYHRRHC